MKYTLYLYNLKHCFLHWKIILLVNTIYNVCNIRHFFSFYIYNLNLLLFSSTFLCMFHVYNVIMCNKLRQKINIHLSLTYLFIFFTDRQSDLLCHRTCDTTRNLYQRMFQWRINKWIGYFLGFTPGCGGYFLQLYLFVIDLKHLFIQINSIFY